MDLWEGVKVQDGFLAKTSKQCGAMWGSLFSSLARSLSVSLSLFRPRPLSLCRWLAGWLAWLGLACRTVGVGDTRSPSPALARYATVRARNSLPPHGIRNLLSPQAFLPPHLSGTHPLSLSLSLSLSLACVLAWGWGPTTPGL